MNFFTYLKGLRMGASGTVTVAAQQLPVTYRIRTNADTVLRIRTNAQTTHRVRADATTVHRIRV